MKGIIVKIISNDYFVESDNKVYSLKPRGKFKNNNTSLKVGDYVIFDKDKKVLEKVLERKNTLERPFVSNIDMAFIVTSLKHPDFSLNLLDKFISFFEINNITPVICITKKDIIEKESFKSIKKILKYYKKLGYKIVYNTNLFQIKRLIKNKVVVFTGQTGAGKSTLINKLDKNLKLETGEISKALGRGKHTTRYVSLLNVGKGKIVDTPGFSSLSLDNYNNEEIKNSFIEFKNYNCKYKDCSHTKEDGCKIINNKNILKSRYDNYLKFIERGKL